MSILDLTKHLMYEFRYGVMKPRYENNIEFFYGDTDSSIYNIKTNNVYQII